MRFKFVDFQQNKLIETNKLRTRLFLIFAELLQICFEICVILVSSTFTIAQRNRFPKRRPPEKINTGELVTQQP